MKSMFGIIVVFLFFFYLPGSEYYLDVRAAGMAYTR